MKNKLKFILTISISLCLVFSATGTAFATQSSTTDLTYGIGDNGTGAYGFAKNFAATVDPFVTGKTYKFSKKTNIMNHQRDKYAPAKIITIKWYMNKKLVSKKLSYKVPQKYMGKNLTVKIKWKYIGAKSTTTETIKSEYMCPERFSIPEANNWSTPKKYTKVSKGFITYKLKHTGFDSLKHGKKVSIKVTPYSVKTFFANATEFNDTGVRSKKNPNGFKASKLKKTKIKYQWYRLSVRANGAAMWVKIKGATKSSYKYNDRDNGVGVVFTISKNGYVTSQGFVNSN